jgi:hypothetical protein
MLYHHHPMPQDRDKQRGKAIVVDGETSGHPGGQQAAPRKLTAVACVDCRKRKRKVITNPNLAQRIPAVLPHLLTSLQLQCNGGRPSCSACQTRGLSCMYDVVEGATRTEDLKQKVSSLSLRVRNLELFVNKLRYSTDNEASAILAQLRLGDTVDGILGAEMADGLSDMGEVDQVMEQCVLPMSWCRLQVLADLGTGHCRHFKACRHLALDLLTTQQVHLCSPTSLSTIHRPRSGVSVLESAVLAWSTGPNGKRLHHDRIRLPHGLLHCLSRLTHSTSCSRTIHTRR